MGAVVTLYDVMIFIGTLVGIGIAGFIVYLLLLVLESDWDH